MPFFLFQDPIVHLVVMTPRFLSALTLSQISLGLDDLDRLEEHCSGSVECPSTGISHVLSSWLDRV